MSHSKLIQAVRRFYSSVVTWLHALSHALKLSQPFFFAIYFVSDQLGVCVWETRVAKGVPCDRQIDNLLTTYKIGKRHKVLCMANLTRHKLPVWVWFRRQRSSLGDLRVTTFRFGCGYGDNVPVWVRLRRQRSGLGAVTVTTFRFGCGCGDNVPRLDVHTAYFRLAVRPVQRGALAISVLPAEKKDEWSRK